MRHAARQLLGVCLVVGCCCHSARAEEAKSSWWPFGGGDEPATAESTTLAPVVLPPDVNTSPTQRAAEEPLPDVGPVKDRPWMIQSPFAKVSWPELRMPKLAFSKPDLPERAAFPDRSKAAEKNSWMEQQPEAARPSPLQAIKNGAHSVSESTKTAWRKTVDAVTPGDQSAGKTAANPRMAHRDPAAKPSFWDRMTGEAEPKQEGPRTITEWMAQDRVE